MYIATDEIAYNMDLYDAVSVDEGMLLLIRDGRQTIVSRFDTEQGALNAYAVLMHKIAKGEKVVWV